MAKQMSFLLIMCGEIKNLTRTRQHVTKTTAQKRVKRGYDNIIFAVPRRKSKILAVTSEFQDWFSKP
jgi:hypothetical protein